MIKHLTDKIEECYDVLQPNFVGSMQMRNLAGTLNRYIANEPLFQLTAIQPFVTLQEQLVQLHNCIYKLAYDTRQDEISVDLQKTSDTLFQLTQTLPSLLEGLTFYIPQVTLDLSFKEQHTKTIAFDNDQQVALVTHFIKQLPHKFEATCSLQLQNKGNLQQFLQDYVIATAKQLDTNRVPIQLLYNGVLYQISWEEALYLNDCVTM